MKKIHIFAISLLTLATISIQTESAQAGGSSFAIRPVGKTAFVKPGQVVSTLQQVNVETYFLNEYWPVKMLRVEKVTVDCSGDNVMQNASIALGTKTFGSALFKRIPNKANLYEAVIQPKDLVLQNDSFYALAINAKTRNLGWAFRATTCVMKDINFSASNDGKTFTATIEGHEMDGFAVMENPSPSAVVVGYLKRFADSKAGAAFDLSRPPKAFANGAIENIGEGKYRINVFTWNKGDTDYHVSNNGTQSAGPFDLINPTAEQIASTNPYQRWTIQEAHMYASPAANGTVGSIILGKKL